MTVRSEQVTSSHPTRPQANVTVAVVPSPVPVVLGMGNAVAWLAEAWARRVSTDGAMWLLMLNGLFLIPLVLAAFFYPWEALTASGIIVAGSAILIELLHVTRTNRLGWGRSW